MTALAFQNPDLLRALADPALSFDGPTDLARHLGRDKSNTRRTVQGLRDDGVIDPEAYALTDTGRRMLAAIDVAEGKAAAPAPAGAHAASPRGASDSAPGQTPVWPLDKIVRNPANRTVDPDLIPAMADSLVAQGQLQPVTLTPVRDDGTRMLLIGERRWLGAQLAAEQGRLPDSLKAGLRFEEREATPAEAIAITVVENVERQAIPPLELAFLLRDYADAAGADQARAQTASGRAASDSAQTPAKPLDGKSVAERLGLGVRDVQDKLRIARQATPEALAAYRDHGSWDRLRDSVTEKKPASNGPGWVNGTPYARRFDRHNPTHTAGSLAPDLDWPEGKWEPLADPFDPGTFETFALMPMAHGYPTAQIQVARLRGGVGWVYAAGYSTSAMGHHESMGRITKGKEAFLDRETAIAAGVDLIRDSLGGASKHKLPASIDAWLRLMESEADRPAPTQPESLQDDDPLVVNGVRYPNPTRANEARRAAGILPRHANHGGGATPKATDSADPTIRAMGQDWDRMRTAGAADLAVLTTDRAHARARLALIEIAHKTGDQRRPLDPVNPTEWTGDVDQDFIAHGCTCGAHWLDAPVQTLIQLGAARVVQIPGGAPPMLALTASGLRYLQTYGCALPISGAALAQDQEIAGLPATPRGAAIGYATPCLAKEAAPAPAAAASEGHTAADSVVDLWDRTPEQIAEDASLAARVADTLTGPTDAGAVLSGWYEIDVYSADVSEEGSSVIELPLHEGGAVHLVVDPDSRIPDVRASAIAALIARLLREAA